MRTVEEQLARLADHPPVRPTPAERIVGRAQRHRQRRRALAGVIALAALGGIVAGVIVVGGPDPPPRVETGRGGGRDDARIRADAPAAPVPQGEAIPAVTAPKDGSGLTLNPSTFLVDGAAVTLGLDPPAPRGATVGSVAECAAEVLQYLDVRDGADPLIWCGPARTVRLDDPDHPPRMIASRSLRIRNGTVDCAQSAGRCVVIARLGHPLAPDDRFAALVFQGLSSGPQPSASADGIEGTAYDGQPIRVAGAGFVPGEDVVVAECIGTPQEAGAALCDQARGRPARVDEKGRLETDVLLFHDILVLPAESGGGRPAWKTCAPCLLVLQGSRVQLNLAAFQFDAIAHPLRPTVSIKQRAPYRPGQRVTLLGSGFQSGGGRLKISWCAAHPSPTADRCQDPAGTVPVPRTGAQGQFELARFPLPAAGTVIAGARCSARARNCALAWDAGTDLPYLFSTPLDLSR